MALYEQLVGRSFRIHPYVQTAVLQVIDRNFPATMPLPDRWIWTDEWYEFDAPLAPDLHVVMTVDESTYDPAKIWRGNTPRAWERFIQSPGTTLSKAAAVS